MTPGSIKRFVLTLVLALSAIGLAAPEPSVSSGSGSALLGDSTTVTVAFQNTGDATGYGPYIDFVLPADFGGASDAISFDGADYNADFPLTKVEISYPGGTGSQTVLHPYERDNAGQPVEVVLQQGEKLIVFALPFGSYTTAQPPAEIDLKFTVNGNAVPTDATLNINGGFRYGTSATGTTSVVKKPSGQVTVTPRVFEVNKSFSKRDTNRYESAIGPHFVETYTLEVVIAKGQTVTDLKLEDVLPTNIVLVDGLRLASGSANAAFGSVTLAGNPIPNANIADYTGDKGPFASNPKLVIPLEGITYSTSGHTVIQIEYDSYFPLRDADLKPVGGTAENTVNGTATWDQAPTGLGYDSLSDSATLVVHLENNDEGDEVEASASLKTQKYWGRDANTVGQSDGVVMPGETLHFKVEVQVSDRAAYNDFYLVDIFDDGLEIVPSSAKISITSPFGTVTEQAITPVQLGSGNNHNISLSNGQEAWEFDVSKVLYDYDDLVLGACFDPANLGGLLNDCGEYPSNGVGTTITLTYKAKVLEEYRFGSHPISGNNKGILQGDAFNNKIQVRANALKRLGAGNGFENAQHQVDIDDNSVVSFSVANSTAEKSITHVTYAGASNPLAIGHADVVMVDGLPLLANGDSVTFLFEVTLPSGNVGNFTLTDHLPLPVFDLTGATITFDSINKVDPSNLGTIPADWKAGYALYNPADAAFYTRYNSPAPTVTIQGNSVEFDFGTRQDTDNYSEVHLGIYLTVPVVEKPMADDLLLTNQLEVTEKDNKGSNNSSTALGLSQLKFGRPVLNITNGVVAVGGNTSVGATGGPSLDGDVENINSSSYAPPEIKSGDNRDNFNDNQTNMDGNDEATFLAVIENTGTGPRGAFGVIAKVEVEDGLSIVDGRFAVYKGNSTTALTAGTDYEIVLAPDNKSFTITFKDPSGTQGFLGKAATNGSNIVSVQYVAKINENIPALSTDQYKAIAEITEYYPQKVDTTSTTQVNFAISTPEADKKDEAWVSLYRPAPVKTVTSINPPLGTSTTYAAIGSTVTYEIVLTLPEGHYDRLVVYDNLPTGLGYIPGTAKVTASNANEITTTSPTLAVGTSRDETTGAVTTDTRTTTWNSGEGVYIDFGSVLVNNNDTALNTVTIELQARVLHETNSSSNTAVNSHGNQLQNNARMYASAGTSQQSPLSNNEPVRIVEPNLSVTKSNGATENIQANDTFTYTVVVSNEARSDYDTPPIYNIEVRDVLPPELELTSTVTALADPTTTGITFTTPAAFTGMGLLGDPGALLATINKLEKNESVTFTFEVKVKPDIRSYQVLENTAHVTGDSQDSKNGVPTWDENRVYKADDPDTIQAKEIAPTKEIAGTSEDFTRFVNGTEQVAIGEVITYRLMATLPLGQSNDIRFVDQLHEDLAYVGNPEYYIEALGTNGDATSSAGLNVSTVQATFPPTSWDSLDSTRVSKDGNEVTFNFGTINNGTDAPVTIYLHFDVVVKDSAKNKRGSTIENSFIVVTNDGTKDHETPSEETKATVVTPNLTVDKKAEITAADTDAHDNNDGNVEFADRGETVTYTVTITNRKINENVTSGWGFTFEDELPTGVTYVNNTAKVTNSTVTGIDTNTQVTFDGTNKLSVDLRGDQGTGSQIEFEPGTEIEITYQAVVASSQNPGDEIINTAKAATSSLPDVADDSAKHDTIFEAADNAKVTLGTPELKVSKTMTEQSFDGYDTFELKAVFVIENVGNLRVENLSLVEDLAAVFHDGSNTILESIDSVTIEVAADQVDNRGLTVNPDFEDLTKNDFEVFGDPDSAKGNGIVMVNDVVTVTIEFKVKATAVDQLVDTNSDPVEYTNTAKVNAKSRGGIPAAEVQPEAKETLTYTPGLEVTKTAAPGNIDPNADGTYTVTYTINVENTGNAHLRDFTLTDPFVNALGANFDVVGQITLDNLTFNPNPGTSTIALNNNYDGDGNTSLIDTSNQELKADESFSLKMEVVLQPKADMSAVTGAHITNKATASGTTGVGETVEDNDSAEVTFAIPEPTFTIGKTASNITFDGGSVYTVAFEITAANTSGVKIDKFNITEDLGSVISPFLAAITVTELTATFSAGGSGTTTLFKGFGTGQDILIFDSDVELAAGENVKVSFTATFTLTDVPNYPDATDGKFPFTNEVTGNASTIIGGTYEQAATAPFTLLYNPVLTASKNVVTGSVQHTPDGKHAIDFAIVFKNDGNVNLENFQIIDDIAAVLGTNDFTAKVVVDTSSNILSGAFVSDLTAGKTYSSTSVFDGQFLNPNITLAPNQEIIFTLEITDYTPGNWDDTSSTYLELENNVRAAATVGPAGSTQSYKDIREEATDKFTPEEAPAIKVTKAVSDSAPTYQSPDAGYHITFTITVENTGDVDLRDLSVHEDLAAALGVVDFTIDNVTLSSTDPTNTIEKNSTWNGGTDTELIDDGQVLKQGETLTITIGLTGVQIPDNAADTANAPIDERTNTVNVSGVAPITRTVEDEAEAKFTPVDNAAISVIKTAIIEPGSVDGAFVIYLTFDITNDGPVTLSDIQLFDDLTNSGNPSLADIANFSAATFSKTAGNLNFNTNYQTGGGDYNILASGQELEPGKTESITVKIDKVTLINSANTVAENQADVNGKAHGRRVTNTSHNGVSTGPNDPTPIVLDTPRLEKNFVVGAAITDVNQDVNIGETITYRLSVELSENTYNDLWISDTLPGGLQLDEDYGVRVTTSGEATKFLQDSVDVSQALNSDADIQARLDNAQKEGSGVTNAGFTIDLGKFEVAGPSSTEAPTIHVEFKALVLNDAQNAAGDPTTSEKRNSFTMGYGSGGTAPALTSNEITANIVEPKLVVTKVVSAIIDSDQGTIDTTSGNATNVDRGDVLEFTITVKNVGNGPAYGLAMVDAIPDGMEISNFNQIAYELDGNSQTPSTINLTWDDPGRVDEKLMVEYFLNVLTIPAGSTLTIVYEATVNDHTDNTSGAVLVNEVEATSTSTNDPSNPQNRDTSDDDTATVTLAEPTLEITKSLESMTYNGGQEFTFVFGFEIKNTGLIDLNRVTITDALPFTQTQVDPVTVTVPDATWTGDTTSYDGYTNTTVYNGEMPTLAPNATSAKVIVTVVATLEHIDDLNAYTNTAKAVGRTPGGDGIETPEHSNDETFTPRDIYQPSVGITKSATPPVNNGDGSYTTTYTIVVVNDSDDETGVDLVNPQVIDNLATTFADAASFTVDSASATHSDNTDYSVLLVDLTTFGQTADAKLIDYTNGSITLKRPTATDPGEALTIEFTVTFWPEPSATNDTYDNVASTTTESPFENGPPIDGSTPPVPVTYDEAGLLGVSTSYDQPATVDHGDGSYTITLEIDLKNYGITTANGVQLDNISVPFDLADYFSDAAYFEYVGGTLSATNGFAVNLSYDGNTDTELLVPSDTDVLYAQDQDANLGPKDTKITLEVLVVPGNELYYEVETTATAKTPLGRTATDDSNDGGDPDNGGPHNPGDDGDGDPTNNTAPTPILFPDEPLIGAAKAFEQTSLGVTGTPGEFTLTFTFVVQNYGNAQLNDVSLTDNFDNVFNDGSNWAVTDIRVIDGSVAPATTLPTKSAPNGYELLDTANSQLASEAQAALPNATLTQQATVEVDLVVTPNTPGREYENTAVAEGTSPSTPTNPAGTTTDDESQDGLDPDPDGDGDPTNNNDPTPFRFERPDIGVTKSATTDIRPDGQMDVYYTFTITNEGDVDLSNVQLTDNLDNALGAGNYRVMSLYSSTLTVNVIAPTVGGFNGSSVTELLAGTDTIQTGKPYADPIEPGAPHEVHLHVVVKDPDANGATNTAYVVGTSPAQNVVDDSATHTVVPNENPHIALAKSATVNLLADGTFNVDYRFTVANVGNVELRNVQITDDLADVYASTDVTAADISRVYSELTYNPSFDGQTDPNVLTGTDTLKVGQEKTVIIRLRGITANYANAIVNSATATGTGPYGGTTTDKSNDGLTPEPGTDVPTEIILVPTTQIAIAKQSVAQQRADGGYDVTFTLRVANVGNSQLLGVQVRDTLEDFYAKTNLTASKISVSSSDFAVNPSFDGQNDSDLLTGTDVLAVGGAGTITIDLTNVRPNSGVTEVENTAIATGRDATGKRTTDTSNDGVTPDPNDDTPTITPLSPQPQIGIAKRAAVTLVSGNTYTAVFDFVLKNYGNTDIHSVQVTDDLSEFYTEVGLSAANISVSAAGLTPNPSYDGQTDTNVLSGSDTLQLGETKTITITLTGLVVANPPKTLLNTAVATGTDPSGNVPTEDTSTDGDDPDPDGNNDPTDNDDPTPVTFDAEPLLGLAKDVTVEPGSTEGLKITFDILVRNYGNTDIVNLQVVDDLATHLLSRADSHDAPDVTSTDFVANNAFDGDADTNLLAGTDTLAVGGEGIITIVIDNFVPNPRYNHGENLAEGAGETPGGDPVRDKSYPGTDPDPDGDGDPTNNDEPTNVPFTVQPPVVGIAKKATVADNGDGTFDVTLLFTVKNYSKASAANIQIRDNLADLYAQTTLAPSDITLTSGDFTVSTTYNGTTDVNLLAGTDTLGAGATGTVTMNIAGIAATSTEVEVYNTAIVTGDDPRTGRPIVPDESTDGEDPDPDGDGNPHNNNTPTPITFHVAPKIGLAKAATVNAKSDGVHDITFTIRAVNYGDVELTNVSITDSLAEFYTRTNLTASNVSVSSPNFSINPLYDGQANIELLGSGNSLAIGASGTVTITLTDVIPAADVTRLYNSAFVTAEAPGGRTVDDTSHNGHDPDPTGGNNPGDYNDPTPVDFTPVGSVLLEKTAAKGEYEIGDAITYTVVVSNPHDVAITFTLEDNIPANTLYIEGTTTFSDANYIPLDGSEPLQKDHTSLEWRSIVLPHGEQLTITYQLRILPGAEGALTNVVKINGEDANSKKFTDETTANVKVKQGIFDRNKSVLIGRVFVDVNNNSIYDEGIDIPVEHARVILSNGWQTTTDGQGNYAFRNIDSGTWSVQLDERTAPYATQRHPEQLRDRYQHRVSVQGVTVSDFPLIGVIGDIETERQTFVSYGPVTLHKYVVATDAATDTVVITISSTEELPAEILLTDPQPDGTAATYVVQPTPPGAETTITYELPAGSAFTDPILEWSDQ